MASQDASQSQKATDTQYPSESSAFAGQRVWVSPEFGKSLDLYRWIVSNHSATLVEQIGEKDVFHLLPTFQGPIFDRLSSEGRKIIGVPCLATSVREGVALPLVENEEEAGKWVPVFSRALDGTYIATSHLSAAFRKNIRTMVLLSCGNYQSTLDSNTTVLITKRNGGDKYFAAARAKIPSVTPQWIRDVFRTSTFINPQNYIVPPFANLIFCATGFTREERQKLSTKIGLYGGSWSPELKRSVTHLIVDLDNNDNNSKKLQYALQWGVKIVSQFWVRACIENGFFCPTDDTTRHLTHPAQSALDQSTKTQDPSPDLGSTVEKNPASFLPSARYAGLTPAPPMSRETSTVTSGDSEHHNNSDQINLTTHSSYLNGSSMVGNTPFRRVSVRKSHLDLRAATHHRQPKNRHSSSTSHVNAHSTTTGAHDEEDDELEGDRPDDVDADSEEEKEVVLAASQPTTTSNHHNQHHNHNHPQNHQRRDTHNSNANSTSGSLNSAQKVQHTGDLAQEQSLQAIVVGVETKKGAENEESENAALYEDLDRQTQEALVNQALDVYFKGPMMDEKEAEEALQNDQNFMDGSKSYHFFDGVVVSVIGVPPKDDYDSLDERVRRQLDELESAEKEFCDRGGTLALPSKSPRVLIFDLGRVSRQEAAVIRDKEVLSSDWLTDSILLELLQNIETYRLTWSNEKNTFQSLTPKFWTSSCILGSEKTTPQKAPESSGAPRSQFDRSSISFREKDVLKAQPPISPATSNPTREAGVDMVALHKRQILPPTSISASHLLLKSALHINTLRKMDKIQRDGKKHAKTREVKSLRDSHVPARQMDDIPHPYDQNHARSRALRPTSERPGGQDPKNMKSKSSSTPYMETTKNGNRANVDTVEEMEAKDLKQVLEKRKLGASLGSESDSDSIVGSPLTISAKMQSAKKRKLAPAHDRPLLEVQGVKKWKILEPEERDDVTSTAHTSHRDENASNRADHGSSDGKISQESNIGLLSSMHSDPPDSLHDSYRSPMMMSTAQDEPEQGENGGGHLAIDFLTQTMRGEKVPATATSEIGSEKVTSGVVGDPKEREMEHRVVEASSPSDEAMLDHHSENSMEIDLLGRLEKEKRQEVLSVRREESEKMRVMIQSLTPLSGPKEGGDSVIVTLDRVDPTMKVVFGTVEAETIVHTTKAKLWATTPSSAIALPVPISIIDGLGRKVNMDTKRFEYTYM